MRKFFLLVCLSLTLLPLEGMAVDRYRVGVCDWMILKRQKMTAFATARKIGADGIELDMGGLGKREMFDNQLRDDRQAAFFRHLADSCGIVIGAMAMSGFYGQDLTARDNYMALVDDCLATMDRMGGVSVAFLPLGGCGNDWPTDKAKRKEIVRRLHAIGERARAQGKTVGIDTPLDAKGNLRLLREIGSDGIRIFYKWQTAVENGRDLVEDLRRLGAKNICAMHASVSDGVTLRHDTRVDVPAVKAALDKMGWSGWLFVERSRDTTRVRQVTANYGDNVNYLKSIFNQVPEAEVKLNSDGRDAAYVQTISDRARKVTDELGITYTPAGVNVQNIVANRYFELNDIYSERDSLKKTDGKYADARKDARLYRTHGDFVARLEKYLPPQSVTTVKDVMTYHVYDVTLKAYQDMIPSLKPEEIGQIAIWLREAREYAIDEESSNKKHAMFKKYKGRINNYLTARGYDIQKEREAWEKRVKAAGGRL